VKKKEEHFTPDERIMFFSRKETLSPLSHYLELNINFSIVILIELFNTKKAWKKS
jgi:hypothetical protein